MRSKHLGIARRPVAVLWVVLPSVACGGSNFAPASSADSGATTDASEEDIIVTGDSGGSSMVDSSADTGSRDAGVEASCSPPMTLDCNGTCVDPTKPAHCGTCSNVCEGPDSGSGMATCTNGTCGLGCSGTTSLNCGGACVNPASVDNCGSCGHVCPGASAGTGTAQCTAGGDGGLECTVTCDGTTTMQCGTACYSPTDPNHCGSCSASPCPAPTNGNGAAACTGTMCTVACNSGFHACASNTTCESNTDDPSNANDPCVIANAYGIFVSPQGSDAAGCGTMASPCGTVGHAMDLAHGGVNRVYACGSAGSYNESLVVGASRDGVTVYGGLNCSASQWTYSASDLAVLAPTAAGYALQVTGLSTGVVFTDFAFTSAATTTAGASSIAVFVSSAQNVAFSGVTMTAGSAASATGATGASGGTSGDPSNHYGGSLDGNNGSDPLSGPAGGLSNTCQCRDTTTSVGASGGDTSGHGPSAGQPALGGGAAGVNGNQCNSGGGGGDGNDASQQAATPPSTSLGTLTASGWTPATGATGANGGVAQGGGGGGRAQCAARRRRRWFLRRVRRSGGSRWRRRRFEHRAPFVRLQRFAGRLHAQCQRCCGGWHWGSRRSGAGPGHCRQPRWRRLHRWCGGQRIGRKWWPGRSWWRVRRHWLRGNGSRREHDHRHRRGRGRLGSGWRGRYERRCGRATRGRRSTGRRADGAASALRRAAWGRRS